MSTPRTLSAATAVTAVAVLLASQAAAHAALVRSDPAANASVTPPKTISLTFSERLTPAFSGFEVVTGGGTKMPVKATFSSDHKSIQGAPTRPMTPGLYRIVWHAAASDDGHRTEGSLAFRVK
jgi:methionine-rich copper-binding protein CopC